MNKVFTYMVIHDLKHPTETTNSKLKDIESRLFNQQDAYEATLQDLEHLSEKINNLFPAEPLNNRDSVLNLESIVMQPSFHDSEEEEALSISINLADCNEGDKRLPYLAHN